MKVRLQTLHALLHWLPLAVFLAACFAAAGVGSLFTGPALDGWYATLSKPAWTPPAWVFGPVWTALYVSMAVAAWLVWRERGLSGARPQLALFGAQLVLNALWSALFFGLRSPGAALVEIFLLWCAVYAATLSFLRVAALPAALMLPYLLWVSFAALLNFAIWRMNG